MFVTCFNSEKMLYNSVVQDVARGPKLAFWGFLLGPFKKSFCNGYWPFDGPLIIEMQEFTWVGWIGELHACTGTVKCHLVMYIVQCTLYVQ